MVGFGCRAVLTSVQNILMHEHTRRTQPNETRLIIHYNRCQTPRSRSRQKPCWGSLECSGCSGGPKHGKTTGFLPYSLPNHRSELRRNEKSSRPGLSPLSDPFQEIIVAPNKRITASAPTRYEQIHETHQLSPVPFGCFSRTFHRLFRRHGESLETRIQVTVTEYTSLRNTPCTTPGTWDPSQAQHYSGRPIKGPS